MIEGLVYALIWLVILAIVLGVIVWAAGQFGEFIPASILKIITVIAVVIFVIGALLILVSVIGGPPAALAR